MVILAAGMGSRYGGDKQLDRFGPSGETIMDYSVYDAIRAGYNKVVFVIRHDFAEAFKKGFISKWDGKVAIDLAFQSVEDVPAGVSYHPDRTKPWGTAHAMLMARQVVNEPFAVLNADDFYGKEAFQTMAAFLREGSAAQTGRYAMCGYKLGNTLSKHGSVSRGICKDDAQHLLISVEEHTKIYLDESGQIATDFNGQINRLSPNDIVSMNFWGFTPDVFAHTNSIFIDFLKERAFDPKSELYIPYVIDKLINSGQATVQVLQSDAVWFGVTYADDKPTTMQSIRELVAKGVYPENLWG